MLKIYINEKTDRWVLYIKGKKTFLSIVNKNV